MSPSRVLRNARILAVVAVVIMLAVAHSQGWLARFRDPQGMARTLVEAGPWGYAAFIGAYTLLQPFGVPGTVFIVVAPLIWDWPVAFALSMTGATGATVVGFSFARLVAREWVSGLIPERFKKHEAALAERGFATVFVLRFIFWMQPLLHAFFGISRVPFWTHFWASVLGYFLPFLLVSYFGQKIFEMLKELSPAGWLGLAGGMLLIVLATWRVQRARSA